MNHRPPGPEPGALARLSHAPKLVSQNFSIVYAASFRTATSGKLGRLGPPGTKTEPDAQASTVSGLYLYTSTDPTTRQRQLLTRRSVEAVPTVMDASRLEISPDEPKAAIILFYSLLDEQQRRL